MDVFVVLQTEAHMGGTVIGVATTLDGAKAITPQGHGPWQENDDFPSRRRVLAWIGTPSWDAYEIEKWEVTQ